jgi:hypothetical protein
MIEETVVPHQAWTARIVPLDNPGALQGSLLHEDDLLAPVDVGWASGRNGRVN